MVHSVSTHYLACFQWLKSRTFQPINRATTKPDNENDQLFLNDIPILSKLANTKISNLEKMAKVVKEKKPFNLYNKDTCMEFHRLLCEILKHFHKSLNDLKNLHKLTVIRWKQKLEIGQSDLEAIVE